MTGMRSRELRRGRDCEEVPKGSCVVVKVFLKRNEWGREDRGDEVVISGMW